MESDLKPKKLWESSEGKKFDPNLRNKTEMKIHDDFKSDYNLPQNKIPTIK